LTLAEVDEAPFFSAVDVIDEALQSNVVIKSSHGTIFFSVREEIVSPWILRVLIPVCGELLIFDTNQQFATHRSKQCKKQRQMKERSGKASGLYTGDVPF
jgi:hypothetical protein